MNIIYCHLVNVLEGLSVLELVPVLAPDLAHVPAEAPLEDGAQAARVPGRLGGRREDQQLPPVQVVLGNVTARIRKKVTIRWGGKLIPVHPWQN